MEVTSVCPHCGYEQDTAALATPGVGLQDDVEPHAGDASMCGKCGEFSMYDTIDGKIGLRKFTNFEQVLVDADPDVAKVKMAWKLVRDARSGGS